MKKILLLAAAAIMAAFALQAKSVDELRIYINPGHGSWGPNDRPMATIPYPMTSETGRPDTCGFYESNTNLWKCLRLREELIAMGVQASNITMSRVKNGPYPYVSGAADAEIYNRPLSEICEEVEAGNNDMFISVHSNAATEGTTTNYPLYLYRGYDQGQTGNAGYTGAAVEGSDQMALTNWPYHHFDIDFEPQNYYQNSTNVRGDINFYGSYTGRTDPNSGITYYGYLGVLKHGAPGFLIEGYFHTYQPARHRALNPDYDYLEGVRISRGVAAYFNFPMKGTGEIVGTVKDLHEKIVHNLFKYSPNTNDQWLPCNGATVRLLKNGEEVATYNVDNKYNGMFAFFNLEPGEYTLDASCEGYKALFDEYKVPITVTANETSWPLIYLESENYVPDETHYENYPDPAQPGYLKLADNYNFTQAPGNTEFVGVLKDAVQLGDSTVVLTNEGIMPHLYLIKTSTNEFIKELSTEGIYTEDSPGFFSALNAISRTADNKLVGVSLTENQYNSSNVTDGYTRGTARVYIWNNIDEAPSIFAETQNSGNYYNANVGHSILVNGAASKECEIVLTAMTVGSTCNIRLVHILMNEGEQGTVFYDNLYTGGFVGTQTAYGEELHIAVSPNDDAKILLGGMGTITEFTAPDKNAGAATDIEQLSSEFGATGVGFQCFKYAGHSLLVTPYAVEGEVKGVKIIDITGGVQNAKLVKTTNTDIISAKAHHDPILNGLTEHLATAVVDGVDINATLVGANGVTLITTKDVEQDMVKGIYAYGLNSERGEDKYVFTFTANDNAEAAYIIFTDATTGETVGTVEIPNVVEGENTVTLTFDQIPGDNTQKMNWAVNLVGKTIPTITRLNTNDTYSYARIGNIVDKSTESDFFGRIYVVNRTGSAQATNGVYAYNADWTRINDSALHGGMTLGNPFRLATDENGTIYVADWADGHSGVYTLDPANLESNMGTFFEGTHASTGLITDANGDVVASSICSVYITGSGADTRMYCHLEDYNADIAQYNIGNPDGSIMTSWATMPTRLWGIGGYLASEHASVFNETEDGGLWIVQNRGAGNNTPGVPSLMYFDSEGHIQFNSGLEDNPVHYDINGTQYAAGAMSNDGTELVVNEPDGTLKFFSVDYDEDGVPVLAYKHQYKAGAGNLVTQINYDYAGNLVVSGNKLVILSMPTEDNQTTTPAKKALLVYKELESAYYVVGGFNDWNANEPLEITEDGATFDVVEDPDDVESKEFKILTNGVNDWLWLGGEDANGVGYFEVTDGMMTAGTEITLDDAGANFRLPGSGNYTITLAKEAATTGDKAPVEGVKIVVKKNNQTPTAVTDVKGKTVSSVKYVNLAGIESSKPFDGWNIVVTTYTDGTQSTAKVLR